MKSSHALILSLLITLFISLNVSLLGSINKSVRKPLIITRVIDGDTLITEEGTTIRLLNINTPEKNNPGYQEALSFLKKLENKTVEIEELETEKYGRTLARVYSPNYLNLEIVSLGLAKKFLVDEAETKEFNEAEEEAVENSRGLWKKSPYYNCLSAKIDQKDEVIYLKSKCGKIYIKNWYLTDESRKEYKFGNLSIDEINIHSKSGANTETNLFWKSKQNIWNNDRDTLYVFDEKNNLVHHQSYGY
ncbi:MAG: thermonuclease family protein [Nanoarchaeota archaeon]